MALESFRPQVADSWVRSAASGIDPGETDTHITLPESSLRDYRKVHPLARVFPVLDDVLGRAARDCDTIMAVSDAAGQLLWVCGSGRALRAAESIGFIEGSNWDERIVGTNAPGTALALDQPVSVIGAEHFRHSVQRWSCVATPIHDPVSNRILGVLDVTGDDHLVVPQTMGMVRAAARMAEAELAREFFSRPESLACRSSQHLRLTLQSLGHNELLLTVDGGGKRQKDLRLSPRHSEILVLLASAQQGLSGDELAVLLYDDDGISGSTLRAELNRVRQILGDEVLASRPYRLTAELRADWLAVEAHLSCGDLFAAMRTYGGPVLPRSIAPGVVRFREHLEATLRDAVLRSKNADLMSRWTRSFWGSDDYEMWQAQLTTSGPSSPLLPMIRRQIARLDEEYGVPSSARGEAYVAGPNGGRRSSWQRSRNVPRRTFD